MSEEPSQVHSTKRTPTPAALREIVRARIVWTILVAYMVLLVFFGTALVLKTVAISDLATVGTVFLAPINGLVQFALGYYFGSNKRDSQ